MNPLGLQFGGFDTDPNKIVLHLLANHFVIANVMKGRHWVLVTAVGSGFVNVNDPGFEV